MNQKNNRKNTSGKRKTYPKKNAVYKNNKYKNNKHNNNKRIIKKYRNRHKEVIRKLKRLLFMTVLLFSLLFIIPAAMPADKVPRVIHSIRTVGFSSWKHLSELDTIDVFMESVCDWIDNLQELLSRIWGTWNYVEQKVHSSEEEEADSIQLDSIPDYKGVPYVSLNNNVPTFTREELKTKSYEYYSELDILGRCGVTMACIGRDIMPTEERGAIGMVKPSGWKLKKYDIIDGMYIYNRCHMIG